MTATVTATRRVLVVDDHRVLADLVAEALDAAPDLECVGVVGDAPRALAVARATRPDTVLLDVQLPSGDGLELPRQLPPRDDRPRAPAPLTHSHLCVGSARYRGRTAGGVHRMRRHVTTDLARQPAAARAARVPGPTRGPGVVAGAPRLDARSMLDLQRTIGNSATVTVMREFLPVARHREVVVDAATRLASPSTASDSEWIRAIYAELQGTGNPAADKCVDQLIEQRIIDRADWGRIEADYKLYKKTAGTGFDLFERHAMPKIFTEEAADKWVSSLITHRIDDLYHTLAGFDGHAQQVQLGINQVVGAYRDGRFPEAAFVRYKKRIIAALRKGRAETRLGIPPFVYTFENGSTTTIG